MPPFFFQQHIAVAAMRAAKRPPMLPSCALFAARCFSPDDKRAASDAPTPSDMTIHAVHFAFNDFFLLSSACRDASTT